MASCVIADMLALAISHEIHFSFSVNLCILCHIPLYNMFIIDIFGHKRQDRYQSSFSSSKYEVAASGRVT